MTNEYTCLLSEELRSIRKTRNLFYNGLAFSYGETYEVIAFLGVTELYK